MKKRFDGMKICATLRVHYFFVYNVFHNHPKCMAEDNSMLCCTLSPTKINGINMNGRMDMEEGERFAQMQLISCCVLCIDPIL